MTTEEKKEKYRTTNRNRIGYRQDYRKQRVLRYLSCNSNCHYKNGKISAFDLWKIAKKQKMLCPLTGEKLTSENASVDHIVSKSQGGLNTPSNIRLILKPINIAKQTMTDEMFIELCKKVVCHSNPSSVH